MNIALKSLEMYKEEYSERYFLHAVYKYENDGEVGIFEFQKIELPLSSGFSLRSEGATDTFIDIGFGECRVHSVLDESHVVKMTRKIVTKEGSD